MNNKSRLNLGFVNQQRVLITRIYFTNEQRHEIIRDYLSSGKTKREIWKKYTGQEEEHGQILQWMRNFGYHENYPNRRPNFVSNPAQMKKKNDNQASDSFENLQLKKRIEELEKQLKDAEMKAIAFSTMVDIAEKEFNIPIRKKHNTKPSKK